MNLSSNIDFDLKVIVLGHVSTGKSSFISRLTQDIYINNPISTNNVQFYEKRMIITNEDDTDDELKSESKKPSNEEGDTNLENNRNLSQNNDEDYEKEKKYVVRLKIWDTAGAERYMSITKSYLRDSNIILLFFDLNNRETFLDLDRHWWEMLYDGDYIKTSVIILVCNKCDLKQVVTDEEIQDFCNNHNDILNIKVSPKDGTNVNEAMQLALQEYLRLIKSNKLQYTSSKKVELGEPLDEKNELSEDTQYSIQPGWSYWCKC